MLSVLVARMECFANPTGGVVIDGNAVIQNAVPGLTTILQNSDRAVIDWQSFSIGTGERTNFIVPNATSATLNRVLGCDPSILNGTLTSNGHLFLINSNGVIFGKGSTVDVAGLTASTLDLDNCMFMNSGELVFKGDSQAVVKNSGMIKASTGDVFLIGYQVSNSGTIMARNGTVGLAAGSEVVIRPAGDERVVVRMASGSHKKYGVSNSGVIEANLAELKAHGGNVYALAIRNTGRVAATGVTKDGGRILLRANSGNIESTGALTARSSSGGGGQIVMNAGQKGAVRVGGRVDADGPNGAGGKISIAGEEVEIRRAVAVTADGKTQGGEISIGSETPVGTHAAAASQTFIAGTISASSSQGVGGEIRLGGNSLTIQCGSTISANGARGGGQIFAGSGWAGCSVLDSSCVTVEDGALLTANALQNGQGGKIVVSASLGLVFQGSLQALGGMTLGNGGVAELRAGEELILDHITGRVDLSASHGHAGSLLLQSSTWEISNRCLWDTATNSLSSEDVGNFLNMASLTIQTALGNACDSGDIIMSGTVAWCSANSLTISAARDFQLIDKAGDLGVIDAQSTGGVTIDAGRFVLLEAGTNIGTTGGSVVINANQQASSYMGRAGITLDGGITTYGGNVSLTGVGVTGAWGMVNAGSGTILIDGNDCAISFAGALTTTNGSATAVRIVDATSVTLGDITTGATGTVVLGGAGGDNLSGALMQAGIINAGTVTGNVGSSVTLDGNNTVANLGAFTSTGAFTFNNVAGGLNVTGNIETRGGAATISTTGGALALGGSSITTGGGNVSLSGTGVTSTGGSVNAGSGTILIDGNDGAVSLAGSLTTTNETAVAVRIINATTASLGDITTGAAGTVTLGESGGDNLSGEVTQTGVINTGILTGNTGSSVALGGSNTVANLGAFTSAGSFTFNDASGGLNVTGAVTTSNNGTASITTAGGSLAVSTGSVAGAGVTLTTTGANDITLGGNVNGNAGTVTLTSGRAINQSGGTISTTGTLTGSAGTSATLNQSNTVGGLGTFTTTGAFTFNDAAGGLNVTGNIETRGGAATISTAGGSLALDGSNITTGGGNVSLSGTGVTSTGGAVNAGGGTILVDGNDGAVNLAGALTTTNTTATAVRVIDATTASLGNITTGAAGAVVLGEAGGDNLSGAVTQTGAINAGTVVGNGGSTVTLDGNNKVVNLGEWASADAFVFKNTAGGLNVTGNVETRGGAATISTTGGALALGSKNITTNGGNVSLSGTGVTSTGGAVNAGGGTILVDGNDGAVNLAGSLKTTNETATAVRVIDATTASLGNITTGAAGTVVLGEAGGDNLSGAVTQTGAINAGTVTGNTGSTVTLDGNNTVVNLGEWASADAFVLKDTTGGLNVTTNVTTNGGAASISTTGGALALGGSNITTGGGNVSLSGTGVTSTGGAVNAGGGTILVDGNDGAVNLAGALTTTNATATAVRVVDATTVSVGNVTTGTAGTMTLGDAGGDGLSGAVTQTGAITAASLILAGSGDFTLTGTTNAVGTVATQGTVGSLSLTNSIGLTIGRIGTAAGVNATGDIRISSAGSMAVRENITSQGGVIALSATGIEVNRATISSTGTAAVTLTANQFLLANQPIIKGSLVGTGTNAQVSLNDANITTGENYTIAADKITAGSRVYAFQNMSVLRFELGPGNDNSNTDFFTFDQFLNSGGGSNKLFVNGVQPTTSPLTKPGFGTITFAGFAAPPAPPPKVTLDGTPFGSVLLQNAQPGSGPGGSNGGQTNNFNSTSVSGAGGIGGLGALGAAGGSVAAATSGLLASVTSTIGSSMGFVSAGGGAPPSLNLQSQMGASTSATAESELNAALGGDGTMGVRSSTGLVSVNPQGPPPSAGTVAKLDEGMGLGALSELSLGVFGVSQVPLNSQLGAQPINLGGTAPNDFILQKLAQGASPQALGSMFSALGGNGSAWVDNSSGTIAMDLKGTLVPPYTQSLLAAVISPGAFGELSLALGGLGESVVNASHGLVIMNAAGSQPSPQVMSAILAMLAAPGMSHMSLTLDGEGAGLMDAADGVLSTALDGERPGPFVTAKIADATSQQSLEELDNATR